MSEIVAIFPTPIYVSNLSNLLTEKQINFIKNLETISSYGNSSSKNKYILNEKPLAKLKKELEICVQDYFDKVIQPKENIKPYITQSWCAYTNKNEYHHIHTHANSLVSGVFYVDVNDGEDEITFHKKQQEILKFESYENNLFNMQTLFFKVKKNDVMLFPSTLGHEVKSKNSDNRRISLAFNVFVKGVLGNYQGSTELIL